jgi:pilus assembly protein CpaB
MGGKSAVILVLAVGCGLVAMYGANQLLARPEKKVEMQELLVAARDLGVEEVLKPDMVEVVRKPKSDVPEGSFAAPAEVDGRWVRIKTLKGEPILAAKLAPKDSPPGLIGRIPPGMRAYAIEVNEQTGVSGFILPDHRVDVVQDQRSDRAPESKARRASRTILRNVQVLAVGQVISRPEDKSILVRTVTLAVTPKQVETLVAARAAGPLALALRGLDADGEVAVAEEPDPEPAEAAPEPEPEPPPVRLVSIPPPPPPPPPRPRERRIVIHHGLRRTDVIRLNSRPPGPSAPISSEAGAAVAAATLPAAESGQRP